MGRQKTKIKLPPFVAVVWDILNSRAYIEMKFSSRSALVYFLGKPKVPYGNRDYYELDFSFSYPEANRLGFSKGTFKCVIDELVMFGFVDPVDKGGLRGVGKSCSRFKMSKRWRYYGTDKFIEMDWNTFNPKRAA